MTDTELVREIGLHLPKPKGQQTVWLDAPCSRKLLRVGRRGGKTRFAFIAALAGHGPGWKEGKPKFRGVLQGGDVVWIAQNYPNLTTVLWREEISPRFGHLPFAKLNEQRHDLDIPGLGALLLRSGDREAIDTVRGIGKRLFGVIVDEAAWLDLRGALQDVILLALADNGGWLIIMSTTNAGADGGYNDLGAPQIPSYFNILASEIQQNKRSSEWVEFYSTAHHNPEISASALAELIAEYPPDSPKLKQEVYAELLETGVGFAIVGITLKTHMVPAFKPRPHWNQWAAFDWGYHHPWTFGHYTIDTDGQVYKQDSLMGRLDLPEAIDKKVRAAGIDPSEIEVWAGPDVWRTRVSEKGKVRGQVTGPTVAEELEVLGWRLVPAADARVAGLNNMRGYVHIPEDKPDSRPRFLWMDTPGNRLCLAQVASMSIDPKNPEDALKINADAAGRGGDDYYDETRYGLMARPIASKPQERRSDIEIQQDVPESELVTNEGTVPGSMGWLPGEGW